MIKFPNVKLINTVIGIDLRFDVPKTIKTAKQYMNEKYNNPLTADPHITVLLTPCPEQNIDKCLEELENECRRHLVISFNMGKVEYNDIDKFFSIPIISNDLTEFHNNALEIANNYRENCLRPKDKERFAKGENGGYSEKEKLSVIKYGHRTAGEDFYPHISIGKIRVENYNVDEILVELEKIIGDLSKQVLNARSIHLVAYLDAERQDEQKQIKEISIEI